MKKIIVFFILLSCGFGEAFGDEIQASSGSSSIGVGVGVGGEFNPDFDQSLDQKFEASDPVPYLPNSVSAPVISPNLFSLMGGTAQMHGVRMLADNFFSPVHYDHDTGDSGGTEIVFNSADLPRQASKKKRKLFFTFDGRANGELVGSLSIESKKGKAKKVDLSTLIHDAIDYIDNVRHLQGYNVTLLSSKDAISYGMGVDTKSGGFALSPLVSGLIKGPESMIAGLASGFSKSGGVTVPTSIIGCTFLVLVESDKSSMVDITHNYRPELKNGDRHSNGNGGKKYEATKK